MAAVLGAARLFATAVGLLSVVPTVSGDWIPGMVGRRGGAGGLPHHMLAPAVHYGRIGLVAKARAENMKNAAAVLQLDTPTEEPTPTRHRLVVCNAYRGEMHLAAIHKRPGRAAIPARWANEYFVNKTLISGIPFKTCDVSRMEFKEGDSVVFKAGGMDIGSFNTSGALGVKAGREVSLVLVPYRKPGDKGQGAQFVSHVFRTPKQKGGSQVILADTLKKDSPGRLKMEDRSGRLWPVHDDQEVTLQAGRYHFTALDTEGENLSSTPLTVATVPKNGVSAKYLVLRMEGPPTLSTDDSEEIITFSLPVPSSMKSSASPPSPVTRLDEVKPSEPTRMEDAPPTVTVAPLTDEEKEEQAKVARRKKSGMDDEVSPTPPTPNPDSTIETTDETLSATQLSATSQQSGSSAMHAFSGGVLLLLAGIAAVF